MATAGHRQTQKAPIGSPKKLIQLQTSNSQKALAVCGAASLCLYHGRLLSAFVSLSSMWREDFLATTSRIRNDKKKEQRKIARGIFRSLAPLLGLGNCRLSLGLWYQADDSGT